MNTTPAISQYIYNKNRQMIGVLAATVADSGNVTIGWSLCAKNRGDKFDKVRGNELALNRSLKESTVTMPDSIAENLNIFAPRVCRYFKDRLISDGNFPKILKKNVDASPKVTFDSAVRG